MAFELERRPEVRSSLYNSRKNSIIASLGFTLRAGLFLVSTTAPWWTPTVATRALACEDPRVDGRCLHHTLTVIVVRVSGHYALHNIRADSFVRLVDDAGTAANTYPLPCLGNQNHASRNLLKLVLGDSRKSTRVHAAGIERQSEKQPQGHQVVPAIAALVRGS